VTNLPPAGTYVLELVNSARQRLEIGRLGDLGLAPGIYLYVGSAKRHLPHRIARHRKATKALRWHVDYVTAHARVTRVAVWDCAEVGECELAEAVRSLPGAQVVMRGFGSSDCGCEAHFVRLEGEGDWAAGLSAKFGPPLRDVQYGRRG